MFRLQFVAERVAHSSNPFLPVFLVLHDKLDTLRLFQLAAMRQEQAQPNVRLTAQLIGIQVNAAAFRRENLF